MRRHLHARQLELGGIKPTQDALQSLIAVTKGLADRRVFKIASSGAAGCRPHQVRSGEFLLLETTLGMSQTLQWLCCYELCRWFSCWAPPRETTPHIQSRTGLQRVREGTKTHIIGGNGVWVPQLSPLEKALLKCRGRSAAATMKHCLPLSLRPCKMKTLLLSFPTQLLSGLAASDLYSWCIIKKPFPFISQAVCRFLKCPLVTISFCWQTIKLAPGF